MIITLSKNFISGLNKRYQYNGFTQVLDENHYYLLTISIKNTPFYICVPLHSYCRSNFLPIDPPNKSNHWKKHGLEYGKMLLLKKDDIITNAQDSGIDTDVWNDIVAKKNSLISLVESYFKNIMESMGKKENNLILSKEESTNLNYSTLNCFTDYIDELRLLNEGILEFDFVNLSSIQDLVNHS